MLTQKRSNAHIFKRFGRIPPRDLRELRICTHRAIDIFDIINIKQISYQWSICFIRGPALPHTPVCKPRLGEEQADLFAQLPNCSLNRLLAGFRLTARLHPLRRTLFTN